MRLEQATKEQIAAIYEESHAHWGVGLSLADYQGLWDDVSRTEWARDNLRFCVWLDDRDRVRSSLKLYRPRVRIGERHFSATVLGAIFTPRHSRRRGFAAELVRAVIEAATRRGDGVALLFSDIGTEYYEGFGFTELPSEEQWGTLPRKPAVDAAVADDWVLRPFEEEDLDAMRSAHDDSIASRPIAFLRDGAHWDFLRVRSDSYFRRLEDANVRQVTTVALHRRRFAGYFSAVEGRGEWNIREVGARGGDLRAMATMLRIGAAAASLSGLRKFYGWLPPELVEQLSDWKTRKAPRRRAVPMLLPLVDGLDVRELTTPRGGFIPYQDQF